MNHKEWLDELVSADKNQAWETLKSLAERRLEVAPGDLNAIIALKKANLWLDPALLEAYWATQQSLDRQVSAEPQYRFPEDEYTVIVPLPEPADSPTETPQETSIETIANLSRESTRRLLLFILLLLIGASYTFNARTQDPAPPATRQTERDPTAFYDEVRKNCNSYRPSDRERCVRLTEWAKPALATAERDGYYSAYPAIIIDTSKSYEAIIKTERGDMRFALYTAEAPLAVNNFIFLSQQDFYNDTMFHRVIEGFMAQAGDPSGTGRGGPGYTFEDEVDNDLSFDKRGLLAMANAGPATNGSQFFITFGPTPHLTGSHTIFGKLIEGDDVLSSIRIRDPQESAPGDLIRSIEIIDYPARTPTQQATPVPSPTPHALSSMIDGQITLGFGGQVEGRCQVEDVRSASGANFSIDPWVYLAIPYTEALVGKQLSYRWLNPDGSTISRSSEIVGDTADGGDKCILKATRFGENAQGGRIRLELRVDNNIVYHEHISILD